MDTDKDTAAPAAERPESADEAPHGPDPRVRWRRETLVPTLAVAVVAVTAVITSVMVQRNGSSSAEQVADTSVSDKSVVTAPPLKPAPPVAAKASPQGAESRPASHAMGASAACRNCGVVQMVVAVHDYGQPKPSSYQMHIRMDDGTTRTVEQRGALAAGSRVMVEGKSVRVLAAPLPGQS
ncbi:hypothetical protein [Caenimonas soli]|uniref:hypothetical protein n=1 Tax=Caenimonas soli TaxID=2735555 RepID=UPI0015568D4E|nr:hypothetical protein [Caenimonas soli]NPC55401.1 hypothetical protein [Caenimonas soli]